MPVRFRCSQCQGLMAISTRRIGDVVPCPYCAQELVVPAEDAVELPVVNEQAPEPDVVPEPTELAASSEPEEETSTRAEPLVFAPRQASRFTAVEPESHEAAAGHLEADAEADWSLKRGSRFEEDELDLTAMVDVVFQLLIFFMVTASFSLQKSIEVPTPDQPKQGLAQALKPLEELQDVAILVGIDDRNSVTVDDDPVADLSELPDVLGDRMRRDQKSELILTSSRNATHRTVIAVIDAANKAGMQRIRMASATSTHE